MIYFMRADDDGPVKIGWSKNPVVRSFQIRPTPLTELTIIRLIDGPAWVEKWFHWQFDELRLNGEWFTFDDRMMTLEPPEDRPDGALCCPSMKTEQITIRLPTARVAALKAAAKAEHRSLAQQVEHLLAQTDPPKS